MNITKQNKHLNKAIHMNIIAKEIEVKVNKSQITQIVAEALTKDDRRMKSALTTAVDGIFTEQFPDYNHYSVAGIDENGNLRVVLKDTRKEESATEPVEGENLVETLREEEDEPTISGGVAS